MTTLVAMLSHVTKQPKRCKTMPVKYYSITISPEESTLTLDADNDQF